VKRQKWIWVALGAVLLLAACQAASPTTAAVEQKGGAGTIPTTVEGVPRISLDELRGLLDKGANVTLIDTRSAGEYTSGHIPGSLSVPYAEIEARYKEIPATSKVVLYCA
jgi:3-mercaptopyruvate sulfurtransferase SseA